MRADRLLSIVLLLQIHRRMTAHELARRLEVSDRTIYRDMDALSAAGIPVYAERGTGGGCSLLEAYRTNLTGLTEAEVRTLFLPGTSRLVADLGLSDAFEAAFLKLLAALPSIYHRAAEDARQRIYVDTTRWNYPAEHVPHLHTIQEAVWQERKLQLSYQRGDGTTVQRLVDPLGLVAKAGVWYLVAAVEGETRTSSKPVHQARTAGPRSNLPLNRKTPPVVTYSALAPWQKYWSHQNWARKSQRPPPASPPPTRTDHADPSSKCRSDPCGRPRGINRRRASRIP